MSTPTPEQVRVAIHHLLKDIYGDLEAAARELGVSYKVLWKNFALPGPAERNKTVTLDYLMGIYASVREQHPTRTVDFPLFLATINQG